MKFLLNLIPNKIKIWLLNVLYKDIAGKGTCGDTELAHINKDEALLLKLAGGSGTINECTGLKQYGKGGGGSAPAPAPSQPANTTQTTYSTSAASPRRPIARMASWAASNRIRKQPPGATSKCFPVAKREVVPASVNKSTSRWFVVSRFST